MCDKHITKTKKKVPVFKLDALGKVSYKLRYVAVPVFILAFVGSYILQGNLPVEYTGSENDEVGNVFGETNQMAIIEKGSSMWEAAEESSYGGYPREIEEKPLNLEYCKKCNLEMKYV